MDVHNDEIGRCSRIFKANLIRAMTSVPFFESHGFWLRNFTQTGLSAGINTIPSAEALGLLCVADVREREGEIVIYLVSRLSNHDVSVFLMMFDVSNGCRQIREIGKVFVKFRYRSCVSFSGQGTFQLNEQNEPIK